MEVTTIKQMVTIPAPAAKVYTGLTDPKLHSAITGAKATGEAKIGGEFSAWDGYIGGKYLELAPNNKIVCEWQTTEWPEGYPPSKLEINLAPNGDQTELTLIQSEVPAEQAVDYEQGWHDHYWEPMKKYFQS